jgi:thiamine thiazole synthase
MPLSEIKSPGVVEVYADFDCCTDVAIVGGGPSGMTCAYFLAKEGRSRYLERNLHRRGDGAEDAPRIVIQEECDEIVRGRLLRAVSRGLFVGDSVETVTGAPPRPSTRGAHLGQCPVEDAHPRGGQDHRVVLN